MADTQKTAATGRLHVTMAPGEVVEVSGLKTYLPAGGFTGGFPDAETARRVHDEIDLNRAIEAYRFFYPSVSMLACFKGNLEAGARLNERVPTLMTQPHHVFYTGNSDTPYAPILLDLEKTGPIVVELPAGPFICIVNDMNFRWVGDMGLPGPDAGKGGKHLVVPPDYTGEVPKGYHAWCSATYRLMLGIRSVPLDGDMQAAARRISEIQVHPLDPKVPWKPLEYFDLTSKRINLSPLEWECNMRYWEALDEVIQKEPPLEGYRQMYGLLAGLGIVKGQPFQPDARMKGLLEEAARRGAEQMRVVAFADRRPDRVAWPDRQWEWLSLRPENGTFDANAHADLEAREKWFFQAIGTSPAMFRRQAGSGSVYWLGLRDATGAPLDGGKTYKLSLPGPVPAGLFWSLTVYDPLTRSEIETSQGQAALRSLVEKPEPNADGSIDLYFGPKAPAGQEKRWIQTIPGRGWFSYLRLYGPKEPAFNGQWKPGDFVEMKK